MKKTDMITVKNQLDTITKMKMIRETAAAYFMENADGETEYAPFLGEAARIAAWASYYLEGVSFTETDSIYESIIADPELMALYRAGNDDFRSAMRIVSDMVAFEQQKLLQKHIAVVSGFDSLLPAIRELITAFTKQIADFDLTALQKLLPEAEEPKTGGTAYGTD